jgi:WD40 repeat protein/serine/threonine protein kinase/tetratricopeptide (TPR) repeat protein
MNETHGPEGVSQLEQLVEAFEAAWHKGQAPTISDYLPADPTLRRSTLIELVHADLEWRLKAGETARVEDYLERFPELAESDEVLFGLIRAEFEQRRRLEPEVGPEEYGVRFPRLRDAMPTLHSAAAKPAGEPAAPSVPGYEIVEILGRGGMGVVYKARQVALKRLVALKVILAGGHTDAAGRERFRREAEAVARLQHPGIVQVYETGESGGLPYMSLELVGGGSLDKKLAGVPQPPRQAAGLVETVARALQAAHEAGIVHRDLKPANVLLSLSREPAVSGGPALAGGSRLNECGPKITDFGLAKQLEEGAGQTHTGAIMGTPSYMAPEQAEGRVKDVGPRADVYALGAILYEALTGRPPFRGTTPWQTVLQVRDRGPVPPTQLQPGVPRDLETICLKCLQKDQARRYDSAHELAEDLRRFLAGEPIHARPVGTIERALKWMKRRPATAALVGVSSLALVACVGLAVGLFFYGKLEDANRNLDTANKDLDTLNKNLDTANKNLDAAARLASTERDEKEIQRGLAQSAATNEAKLRREIERLKYLAQMSGAWLAWQQLDFPRMRSWIDQYDPKKINASQDLRGFEWYYLRRLAHTELLVLPWNGEGTSLAFSPDGSRVAAAGMGALKEWDARTGKELLSLGHRPNDPNKVLGFAFSPDGTRLATTAIAFNKEGPPLPTSARHIFRIHDAETGKVLHDWIVSTSALPGLAPGSLAFSPDGTRLAAPLAGGVWMWDTKTGKLVERLTPDGDSFQIRSGVVFSPDGKYLTAAGARIKPGEAAGFEVIVWDQAQKKVSTTLRGHTDVVTGVAFSPDSRQIGTSSQDQTVGAWDVGTGRRVQTLKGHSGSVTGVAFTADGRFLVSSGMDQTLRIWDRMPIPQRSRTLKGHFGAVLAVAASPDGERLASLGKDQTVRVWDAFEEQEATTFSQHQSMGGAVAFSPDSALLAGMGSNLQSGATGIRLWDARTGQQKQELNAPDLFGPDGECRALAFVAKDRLLSGHAGGFLKAWDLRTGRQETPPQGHPSKVYGLAFNAHGSRYATCNEQFKVQVWDAATGAEAVSLRGEAGKGWSVAFSPDGQRLAAGCTDSAVRVWDLATGAETFTLKGHRGYAYAVAWSPDGSKLAAAAEDHTVRVWDVADGHQLLSLEGHTSEARSVVFSPDGRRLATGSRDPTVRLWDVDSGEQVLTVDTGQGGVWNLAFSPDGARLACSSATALRLWDAEVPGPAAEAARSAARARRWLDMHRTLAQSAEVAPVEGPAMVVHLGRLIEAEPENSSLYSRRAAVYTKLNQHQKALDDHARALQGNPTDSRLWERMAVTHSALGEYQKAVEDYTKAIDLYREPRPFQPGQPFEQPPQPVYVLRANRGNAYGYLEQWSKAAADYEASVPSVHPSLAASMWGRYLVAVLATGDKDRYRKVYAEMWKRLEQDRDELTIAKLAACGVLIEGASNDPLAVMKLAEKGVAVKRTPLSLLNLGAALHRAGRYDDALKQIHEAQELYGKEDAIFELHRALALGRKGQKEEARVELQKAVQRLDEHAKATSKEPGGPRENWQNVVPLKALRREAEQLLANPKE